MSLYSDLVEVLTPYANKIKGLVTDVGDLSDLDTEDKLNLVAAINEAAQSGGTEIVIDDTLTQSGQAADAKAAGDAISQLSADLSIKAVDLRRYGTFINSLITANGDLSGSVNWGGYLLDLSKCNITKFICVSTSASYYAIGFYNSSNPSSASFLGGVNSINGTLTIDYPSVPEGATHAIVATRQPDRNNIVLYGFLSDQEILNDKADSDKLGTEFNLGQGYYNNLGVLVDSSSYGHTDILNETTVRKNWNITPNSVVAWRLGTVIFRYWSQVDGIVNFDKIVYNFKTTERYAYDLTPTVLSKKVSAIEDFIGETPLGTRADTVTGAIAELNTYMSLGGMDFYNKKVAIIGDSISTNGDFTEQNPYGNVPEIIVQAEDVGVSLSAYPTYYDIGVTVGGHEIVLSDVGSELTFVPTANDVGKMVGKPLSYNPPSTIVWWEILQQELGIIPIPVCWSGSSITSHEDNTDNLKTSYAWHDATIRKCGVRTPGTMNRVPPDIVIIYRGTNDFSHASFARITNNYYDSVPWRYPDTDVITDGYGYLQGLCLTVKKLRAAYPNAIIFLCTMNTFKRVDDSLFAIDNDRNILPQYSKAIRETADFLGCNVINFDKDGITYENCYSEGYIVDSASHPTHPSNKGHKVMGNRALLDLVTQCNSIT